MTFKEGSQGQTFYPGRKPISFGRNIFLISNKISLYGYGEIFLLGNAPYCSGKEGVFRDGCVFRDPQDVSPCWEPMYFHDGASSEPTAFHEDFDRGIVAMRNTLSTLRCSFKMHRPLEHHDTSMTVRQWNLPLMT